VGTLKEYLGGVLTTERLTLRKALNEGRFCLVRSSLGTSLLTAPSGGDLRSRTRRGQETCAEPAR